MLYEKMNQTWWESPELKQDDFWAEVSRNHRLVMLANVLALI